MTNANEMAQKGFDTGFTDANDNELHVGDYVRICGHIGKIVFSCGAFGIFIADEVPWDALEELVRKDSGNRPSFLYNDTFISFWEIVWNLSEDTDEPCLPYVESITATGGIFTDENGNKIHTDPEGPELGVFIPFFEDEKPVENNLSAVRKRFNEIAYSDAVRNLIRKGVNNNG